MADEKTAENEEGAAETGKKKPILIAALAVVLLAVGGGGAAWFFGVFGGGDKPEAAAEAAETTAAAKRAQRRAEMLFVDMPDVLVNLHSLGQRNRFLKLKVALEVEGEAAATQVKALTPRVMDSFQTYLRALTVDEVSGPGSLHRLKEELTARVNLALEPTRVEDVLIKEMLVQ